MTRIFISNLLILCPFDSMTMISEYSPMWSTLHHQYLKLYCAFRWPQWPHYVGWSSCCGPTVWTRLFPIWYRYISKYPTPGGPRSVVSFHVDHWLTWESMITSSQNLNIACRVFSLLKLTSGTSGSHLPNFSSIGEGLESSPYDIKTYFQSLDQWNHWPTSRVEPSSNILNLDGHVSCFILISIS